MLYRTMLFFIKISVPEYCLKWPFASLSLLHKSFLAKNFFDRCAKFTLVCWTIGKSLVLFFVACAREFHAQSEHALFVKICVPEYYLKLPFASLSLLDRDPTRGRAGGQYPEAALLVKRRNSKWFSTNEPEVRFRF